MQLWSEIRRRVLAGELSIRQAAIDYGLNFRTVQKIIASPEPSPAPARGSRTKPVLGPFLPIIHDIIDHDHNAPPKQRHSARRIYERLRDEHGYPGCSSIVRDAVRAYKQTSAEAFVPLLHPPGEAQSDFGHAQVIINGIPRKAALFVLTLPHSNARFGCLFPRECTEAFHEGHRRAFDFFGGVPTRISYDNSKIAVSRLTGVHSRQLTPEFLRLQSHFLFEAHFCRVRRANEKGHVENSVGYLRRNFLVPIPEADCWEDLNSCLAQACRREQVRPAADRSCTTAELLLADCQAFLPLPQEPFEARRIEFVTVSPLSLARFDGNDYSLPTRLARQSLTATGTIDSVRFIHQGEVVAQHRRSWDKGQVSFDPLHYLALLERKSGALDYAKPLANWSLPDCFATLRGRLEQVDPTGGTRRYIGVLRLLESHPLADVTSAVEQALRLSVIDADAVRLLLEQATQCPVGGFDLSGREELQAVQVPAPDLSVYTNLTSKKETP